MNNIGGRKPVIIYRADDVLLIASYSLSFQRAKTMIMYLAQCIQWDL